MSGLELYHAIINGFNKTLIPLLATILLIVTAIVAWFLPHKISTILLKGVENHSM